jgi:hypothetical protein
MNSFKVSKKQIHQDPRMSLISKHNQTIDDLEKESNKLPEYESKLEILIKCKRKQYSKKNPTADIQKLVELDQEVINLTNKIAKIKSQYELSEYLFKSFEFIQNIDNNEYIYKTEQSTNGILDFISVEREKNNEEIYKSYMLKCFPSECPTGYIKSNNNTFCCPECKGNYINDISSGLKICYDCGLTENLTINTIPEWNLAESHDFVKQYNYKRTNHFKEWIVQIQGREGTHVPKEVIDLLLLEIKKERITDKSKITFVKIKEFLKKLKLNKYYEHIPNIIHKITGNVQLIISNELEKKLVKMFNDIQEPFEKYCPKNRKNFLSYSYTLYKFFQLLKKHEYLIYFPLLKSREKLFEQEEIWKRICKELNWDFIKCI